MTTVGAIDVVRDPGPVSFGGSTIDALNQEFQFITIAASPISNDGGGESSIFSEFDVIAGVPEPSSMVVIGMIGMGLISRRRRS